MMLTMANRPTSKSSQWTFLTNHAHVLVCIYRDSSLRTRDIAAAVGITERATQSIIADLVRDGYLIRDKEGRRNVYTVVSDAHFRHPIEAGHRVSDLLDLLENPGNTRRKKRTT